MVHFLTATDRDPKANGAELSTRVLFVCSKNQWRSPTAEAIFRNEPGIEVRSAGTARSACRTVSARDLAWADIVIVMEPKHAQRLRADHPGEMRDKTLHVLDVPDDYRFMDPDLVELLRHAVEPLLDLGR